MDNVAVSRIADELGWGNTVHVAFFGTAVFAGTAGFWTGSGRCEAMMMPMAMPQPIATNQPLQKKYLKTLPVRVRALYA